MTVAWHNSSGLEQSPDKLLQFLVRHIGRSKVFDDVSDEDQHLLVGQAVERTSQTVDAGGER